MIPILTVRQPWAWALIHGGKDVENRSRSLGHYRGPVLIHAAKAFDEEARDRASWPALRDALALRQDAHSQLPLGVILGVADLTDVHDDDEGKPCSPWAEWLEHHHVFANPRALDEPIPYRGNLGLRKTSFDIAGKWLVETTDRCTCGQSGVGGPHEPGCGLEPVALLLDRTTS
ncbi:hypothetical protein ACEYYH_10605 [Microbacterium trichothecenolyticum]|uniref:hypothetical protein n=1 Tax=Microbacterium trichothecenolyticum TaxID=69370 RepID=UPI0035BE7D4A